MNMRTFHKLSEQILNHDEGDKENYLTNYTNKHIQPQVKNKSKLITQDQIVNMKKLNAKKMQQIAYINQKKIEEIKENYERQKTGLIQKYEKIVQEKQEYIKMLEELYSGEPNQEEDKQITNKYMQKSHQVSNYCSRNSERRPQHFSQTLYLHQAPLYNQICYSIKRPTQIGNHSVSDFFSTQRIKSRLTSNQKPKYESSVSSSKVRSQSTNRNSSSRHVLAPAVPPKYSKIL